MSVNRFDEMARSICKDFDELMTIGTLDSFVCHGYPEGRDGERGKALVREISYALTRLSRIMTLDYVPERIPIIQSTVALIRVRDEIKPLQKQFKNALQVLVKDDFLVDIMLSEGPGKPSNTDRPIHKVLETAMVLLDNKIDDYSDSDEWDLPHADDVWDLLGSMWFDPDMWEFNRRQVSPVIANFGQEIPKKLRSRISEAYRAYVFGNWLAVMALARSTLEYILIDKADAHGIGTRDEVNPKFTKKLSKLMKEYDSRYANLDTPMRYIVNSGDSVMHPGADQRILEFPKNEKCARKCIEHLRSCIEVLYQ